MDYHDSVRPFITLRMIQDNIKLAQNHDAVDTVVEVNDTTIVVKVLMVQFITDIPNPMLTPLSRSNTSDIPLQWIFMDLYGSLSDQERILTDACKIFVINGRMLPS